MYPCICGLHGVGICSFEGRGHLSFCIPGAVHVYVVVPIKEAANMFIWQHLSMRLFGCYSPG